MRMKHPFSNRNSYPGLEAAFASRGYDHGHGAGMDMDNSHHDDQEESSSPDRCSSILPSSDILNMSIGARAAIYEQTRHITKYGLDGDRDVIAANGDKHRNGNHGADVSPTKSQNNASDEWDRLMDRTQDNSSMIETMSHCQSNCSFSFMRSMEHISGSSPLDMTCDQSDYFNSSKVLNLGTPEKNKAKVDEASRLARLGVGGSLQNRGGGHDSSLPLNESVSGSASGELEQSGMIGLFNAAMRLGAYEDEKDTDVDADGDGNDALDDDDIGTESFISFHEPNMSIIDLNLHKSTSEEDAMNALDAADKREPTSREGERMNGAEDDENDDDDDDDYQASFISYREPDLSMISRHVGNEAASEFGRSEFDVDVSEIIAPSEFEKMQYSSPYRKSSGERFPISPRFENNYPKGSNESASMKQRVEEPEFSPCTTPIRSMKEDSRTAQKSEESTCKFTGRYSPTAKIAWPSSSPSPTVHSHRTTKNSTGVSPRDSPTAYRSPSWSKGNRGRVSNNILSMESDKVVYKPIPPKAGIDSPVSYRTRPPSGSQSSRHMMKDSYLASSSKAGVNEKSFNRDFEFEQNNNNVIGSDAANQYETTPVSVNDIQRSSLLLKENVSFISPIDKHFSSGERTTNSKTANGTQLNFQSKLSPLTPVDVNLRQEDSIKEGRYFASTSKQQSFRVSNYRNDHALQGKYSKHSPNIPQRMSLRDRYSRPDRFEDSYSVPSSASTHNSSSRISDDEQSPAVNRSLINTFRFMP